MATVLRTSLATSLIISIASPSYASDACECEGTWMDDSGSCAENPIEQHGCPSLEELQRCNPSAKIRQCVTTKAACNGLYPDNIMFQHCHITDPHQRKVLETINKGGDDSKCMLEKVSPKTKELLLYDLTPLKKVQNDSVEADEWDSNWRSEKYGKHGHNDKEYRINICAPLTNLCDDCDQTAAVREVDLHSDDKNSGVHTLGRFNDSSIKSMHNDDLRIELGSGDAAQHQQTGVCTTRKTIIIFFCQENTLGSPIFVDEFNTCEYVFVWNSCAACPLGTPARDNCGPETSVATQETFANKFSAMSPGSLILIVCGIFVSIYLIGGCAYNRFLKGARGWDQFPNSSFWSSTCSSIAAGPGFICATITGKRTTTGISFQTNYKGGLLDDDDVDDDAEDHNA